MLNTTSFTSMLGYYPVVKMEMSEVLANGQIDIVVVVLHPMNQNLKTLSYVQEKSTVVNVGGTG